MSGFCLRCEQSDGRNGRRADLAAPCRTSCHSMFIIVPGLSLTLARSPSIVGAGRFSLTQASRLCSCFVHVRCGPAPHPNFSPRSGHHGQARPPWPRPLPRPQTHRLRHAPRRHGPTTCRHPRLRPPRQTLRHRRSRRHPRPHHQRPAPCRGPRGRAHPPRRTRPGPDANAHPPARRTRATLRPAVTPPDTQPEPQPGDHAQDPRLARLPTEDEIAAAVRRRPVGAVIADICGELGIAPGHLDRAFWDEIRHAITMYGGSLVSFLGNLDRRLAAFCFGDLSDRADPGWPTTPARSPAPSTGPP